MTLENYRRFHAEEIELPWQIVSLKSSH